MTELAETKATTARTPGPVGPSDGTVRLRPVALNAVALDVAGWWGNLQDRNRAVTIPYGTASLDRAGNIGNLQRLLGAPMPYRGFVFNDSDVYKTLEAIAWAGAGREGDDGDAYISRTAELLALAQDADGYLNSAVQGEPGKERFTDLAEGHELYCAGHLFQAAVADHRATGQRRLLDIALRFADLLVREFGAGRRHDYDGHPEVETALVELYRETGDAAYLDLARQFVDDRGARIFTGDRRGDAYFQDAEPVRTATSIVGHAVRALYLEAGVVDVAVETADAELLASSVARWQDMVDHKLYLTGGVGSRHKSEGFGDPYELPPDRAYCETCAAIASIHWNWRLLLATGESRYADLLERTLFNGFASGTGSDGTSFFYSNPLQVREDHAASNEEESGRRLPWYGCACCPPNIMRLVASLHHYLVTTDDSGVQLHQYTSGSVDLSADPYGVRLTVATGYPWRGAVRVLVDATHESPWTLSLRVPAWSAEPVLTLNGEQVRTGSDSGYLRLTRAWHQGDVVELELDMAPRVTHPNRRVDAVRGCVAIERGPLVYCVEAADNPGIDLASVVLDALPSPGPVALSLWPDVQAIELLARASPRRHPPALGGLYTATALAAKDAEPLRLTAIPYYLWANRSSGAMRVWLPAELPDPHDIPGPYSTPIERPTPA